MNLTVTELAKTRLTDLLGERVAATDQGIRIFAQGGGCACSGARFGMGIDAVSQEDAVVRVGALTFIVDADSVPVLEDASIDYVEDVMQQGFSITAPNAATGGGSCGCGGH